MKIERYTFRKLSIWMLLIIGVWSIVFYAFILYEVNDETNDTLENYGNTIVKKILVDTSFLQTQTNILSQYKVQEISTEDYNSYKKCFYDSTAYVALEDENEPVRVMRNAFRAGNDKYYEIKIMLPYIEKDNMLRAIFWLTVILYIVILISTLIIFRNIFRQSINPLYKILDWTRNYKLAKTNAPLKVETSISEFKLLEKELGAMSERSKLAYEQQKQFIENASHELQTPLAICQNKIELLTENSNMTESDLAEIEKINSNLMRIIRMNKSLLLLSRIDNRQFADETDVNISKIIGDMVDDYSEIYVSRNIKFEICGNENLVTRMDESLAVTLIANVLKNAIMHNNLNGGMVKIEISNCSFSVSNTGDEKPLDEKNIFNRFYHSPNKAESTGLGLAIVKSICNLYDIDVKYTYINMHKFDFIFKKNK